MLRAVNHLLNRCPAGLDIYGHMLALQLAHRADSTGCVEGWGVEDLAVACGMSVRALGQRVAVLIELGLLTVTDRTGGPGRKAVYTLDLAAIERACSASGYRQEGA